MRCVKDAPEQRHCPWRYSSSPTAFKEHRTGRENTGVRGMGVDTHPPVRPGVFSCVEPFTHAGGIHAYTLACAPDSQRTA